jgi:hypothetical protein
MKDDVVDSGARLCTVHEPHTWYPPISACERVCRLALTLPCSNVHNDSSQRHKDKEGATKDQRDKIAMERKEVAPEITPSIKMQNGSDQSACSTCTITVRVRNGGNVSLLLVLVLYSCST